MKSKGYEDDADWLKSLIPQKQPWTIVDREIYFDEPVLAQLKDKSNAFDGYVVCNDHTLTPTKYERYIKISDIACTPHPQKQWKPSEHQLKAADETLSLAKGLAMLCGE